MDTTVEGIAAALRSRVAEEDRDSLMMRIGPVRQGVRLVEIGQAGWWQGALLAVDAGPVEIAQTATLLVRGLKKRPMPLTLAEVA